jgi:hypothetical protein
MDVVSGGRGVRAGVDLARQRSASCAPRRMQEGTAEGCGSGIMRSMTNPNTKPAALVLLLLAGMLASSCRKPESAAGAAAPFSGPFTCEVREVDKTVPCIFCLKQSCCAEVQACEREDATCGCLWLCAGNKKMPFDKCASRCPAPTSTTYSSLSKCLDTRCAMCPQEQG